MTAPSLAVAAANRCRFTAATTGGHVESYFWRANDPMAARAIWLKATILAPLAGHPIAEVWVVVFDGATDRVFAHKDTVPFARAVFDDAGEIKVGGCQFRWGELGEASGSAQHGGQACAWQLRWQRCDGPAGDPLSMLPLPAMLDGPFPKSKLLTPLPALAFSGTIECFGHTWKLHDWKGMQGHNWGKEHAYEYAWGQCLFADHGPVDAMVEAFSARVRIAGLLTPRLSCLVVRRGAERYTFNQLVDVWRQKAEVGMRHWKLAMAGKDGTATLEMRATGLPMACLAYGNPNGDVSYCFNSKLAHTTLAVHPTAGAPFELVSAHGGALELLRKQPELGMAVV